MTYEQFVCLVRSKATGDTPWSIRFEADYAAGWETYEWRAVIGRDCYSAETLVELAGVVQRGEHE